MNDHLRDVICNTIMDYEEKVYDFNGVLDKLTEICMEYKSGILEDHTGKLVDNQI